MNRNTSGCWTCRIRKKGDCGGPGTAGDCSKCIELNIECLRGYGERLPPEWRNRYIVDEISKWTRNRNSRWSPTRLSLYGLLEMSQRRLAALASEPYPPGASLSIRPERFSSPLGVAASGYDCASSSPEVSQHPAAQTCPMMVRTPPMAGNALVSGPVFPGSAPLHDMPSGTNMHPYYDGGYPLSLDPSFSGPQGLGDAEFGLPGTDIREMSRGISTPSMGTEAHSFSTSTPVQPEWQSGNVMLSHISGAYAQAAGGHQFFPGGDQWRNAFHVNPNPDMTENPGHYPRVADVAAQYGDTNSGDFPSPNGRIIQDTADQCMMMGTRDVTGAPAAHHAWSHPQEYEDASNTYIGESFQGGHYNSASNNSPS